MNRAKNNKIENLVNSSEFQARLATEFEVFNSIPEMELSQVGQVSSLDDLKSLIKTVTFLDVISLACIHGPTDWEEFLEALLDNTPYVKDLEESKKEEIEELLEENRKAFDPFLNIIGAIDHQLHCGKKKH